MLKQAIKGTEFTEGSKYYRKMDSSTRIPSTEEERLIRKWQREDGQYALSSVVSILLVDIVKGIKEYVTQKEEASSNFNVFVLISYPKDGFHHWENVVHKG